MFGPSAQEINYLEENGWSYNWDNELWTSPYGWPEPMNTEDAVDFQKCCDKM